MLGCSYKFIKCTLQCHTSAVCFLLSGYITSPSRTRISNMQQKQPTKGINMLHINTLGARSGSTIKCLMLVSPIHVTKWSDIKKRSIPFEI